MNMLPDNSKMHFEVSTRLVEYGDGRKFWWWMIMAIMDGKAFGVWKSESRQFKKCHKTRCLKAAREYLTNLRKQSLFGIEVIDDDIKHGEARCGRNCAIALALERNLERMGLNKREDYFDVLPYGAFQGSEDLGIFIKSQREIFKHLPVKKLPLIVYGRSRFFHDYMEHYSMNFDDYKEASFETPEEYAERTGEDVECYPGDTFYGCRFVLNLDAFV